MGVVGVFAAAYFFGRRTGEFFQVRTSPILSQLESLKESPKADPKTSEFSKNKNGGRDSQDLVLGVLEKQQKIYKFLHSLKFVRKENLNPTEYAQIRKKLMAWIHEPKMHWLGQRELLKLAPQWELFESEEERIIALKRMDPRAVYLGTKSDRELIDRSIAEAHGD